jgi:hypothetical protein
MLEETDNPSYFSDESCVICHQNISQLSIIEKEIHVNNCLDKPFYSTSKIVSNINISDDDDEDFQKTNKRAARNFIGDSDLPQKRNKTGKKPKQTITTVLNANINKLSNIDTSKLLSSEITGVSKGKSKTRHEQPKTQSTLIPISAKRADEVDIIHELIVKKFGKKTKICKNVSDIDNELFRIRIEMGEIQKFINKFDERKAAHSKEIKRLLKLRANLQAESTILIGRETRQIEDIIPILFNSPIRNHVFYSNFMTEMRDSNLPRERTTNINAEKVISIFWEISKQSVRINTLLDQQDTLMESIMLDTSGEELYSSSEFHVIVDDSKNKQSTSDKNSLVNKLFKLNPQDKNDVVSACDVIKSLNESSKVIDSAGNPFDSNYDIHNICLKRDEISVLSQFALELECDDSENIDNTQFDCKMNNSGYENISLKFDLNCKFVSPIFCKEIILFSVLYSGNDIISESETDTDVITDVDDEIQLSNI